ncbi:hypothetical protein ACRPOS_007455 [Bartonella heixiaziensis]|uniref:hypothetical protein n=1 Tax=Bartonella heixiaziensis TaxID=1461000 RepID=UPI003908A78F
MVVDWVPMGLESLLENGEMSGLDAWMKGEMCGTGYWCGTFSCGIFMWDGS